MKFLVAILLPLLAACQRTGTERWLPIRTSQVPSPRLDVYHDRDGWSLAGKRYQDQAALRSAVDESGKLPVMITRGKISPLSQNDLMDLGSELSGGGKRRVFFHQARGNIDSIEQSFELSR